VLFVPRHATLLAAASSHSRMNHNRSHGPHAFSVGDLLRKFLTSNRTMFSKARDGLDSDAIDEARRLSEGFAATRMRSYLFVPQLASAAWHFSSFGTPSEIQWKFRELERRESAARAAGAASSAASAAQTQRSQCIQPCSERRRCW
jgi:hypothetical protein